MIGNRKPTHPGIVLREDVLIPLGLTITEAAKRLKVNRNTLSAFLNDRIPLSSEMAVRIGKSTKTTPESWLYMQAKLNLWYAEQKPTNVEELQSVVAI